MAKTKTKKNRVYLKPIKPSYAIGARYRIQLSKIISAMVDDILSVVKREYIKNEDNIIIKDANPTKILDRIIKSKVKEWQRKFANIAPVLSENMVEGVDKHVQGMLKSGLEGLPNNLIQSLVVKFSEGSRAALYASSALIESNVQWIKNIPTDFGGEKLSQIVMQGIQKGNDYDYIADKLIKLGNVTKNRAQYIARDQVFKATGVMVTKRQSQLGIKKSIWKHSKGDKTPRQSHLAADGKVFINDEGCLIDGEYIYPGEKIGCTCFSIPFIEFD